MSLPETSDQKKELTMTLSSCSDSQVHAATLPCDSASLASSLVIPVAAASPPTSSSHADSLVQLNGTASRKVSSDSSHQVPPHNQVTCAVEIHTGEKSKEPGVVLAMTEQPAVPAATATATSTASTPQSCPTTPKTRPLLPYEIYQMRETIV